MNKINFKNIEGKQELMLWIVFEGKKSMKSIFHWIKNPT